MNNNDIQTEAVRSDAPPPRRLTFSFRLKTILGVALIEAVLLTILVWTGMRFLHNSNEMEVAKRADTLTRLVVSNLRPALGAGDLATVRAMVREVVKDPELVYLRVYGPKGLVAEAGVKSALAQPFRADHQLEDAEDGLYDANADIVQDGRNLGRIELGLSIRSLQSLIHNANEMAGGIALVEMLLVAAFSFVLGTLLTRQLRALSQAANRIANGRPGYQLPVRGQDEVAQTVRAFNRMSQRLEENYRQLIEARDRAERTSRALSESEALYRALFEGSRAVELLIDPADGRIIDANRAASHFYGFSREALRGMHIQQINTLAGGAVAAEMLLARGEGRDHFYFRHRLASGEERDVEVHSGPVSVGGRDLLYSIVHDITDRRRAEERLRASEAKYRTIIDTSLEGYWLIDGRTKRTLEVNESLCTMLGYRAEAILGRSPMEFAAPGNAAIFQQQMARISDQDQRSYEIVLRHRDGRDVYTQFNATTLRDEAGEPSQAFAFVTDITARKQAEGELRLAATVIETSSEAILVTDADHRIMAVNPAFAEITGYSAAEVMGRDPALLRSDRHEPAFFEAIGERLRQEGRWRGEVWYRRRDGGLFAALLSISAIHDEAGGLLHHIAVFTDITERKRDEEKIWRQANYDPLTGLPNRKLFADRLDQEVHRAHRERTALALMFIDLDRFKAVNDTLGHALGDQLLQQTAQRLSGVVRESDTVARLGGDEFTVILGRTATAHEAAVVAEKILARLAEPFRLDEHEAFISGSIGITFYPADGETVETLLRNADAAMYRAKAAGRHTYSYFTAELDALAQRRSRLEHDLRQALARGQLELYYQPILDISGTRLLGAEALLRWHHPELGAVPPDEFIPIAEESGEIVPIEQWVLAQACEYAAHWPGAAEAPFVSVNVSSLQCKAGRCEQYVTSTLERSGLAPARLKLEITERLMLEDTEHVLAMLGALRRAGVHIAVDDFGTGYSSLSYLRRFPVDILKIDRSFIDGLPLDADAAALVEAIILMGHSLGLQVVAEGVESAAQLAFLRRAGCDALQGFHFARPMPAAAFERYRSGLAAAADPSDRHADRI